MAGPHLEVLFLVPSLRISSILSQYFHISHCAFSCFHCVPWCRILVHHYLPPQGMQLSNCVITFQCVRFLALSTTFLHSRNARSSWFPLSGRESPFGFCRNGSMEKVHPPIQFPSQCYVFIHPRHGEYWECWRINPILFKGSDSNAGVGIFLQVNNSIWDMAFVLCSNFSLLLCPSLYKSSLQILHICLLYLYPSFSLFLEI